MSGAPDKRYDDPRDLAAASPPFPGAEDLPSIGVGRVEFHRAINRLEREGREGELSARQFIGWLMLTFGLFAVFLGYSIMRSPTHFRKFKA